MAEPARHRLSFAEFAAEVEGSLEKHEWLDGEVRAMTGGTPVHALLQMKVGGALQQALGRGGCGVYSSDLMVRVLATGLATYPDLSVVCGPVQVDPAFAHAATNPTVLVEVLSPRTERWDRGEKFRHYQQIESLRAYVLVNQSSQRLEWFSRQDDGAWAYRSVGPGESLELPAMGLRIEVDAIYEGTEVPRLPTLALFLAEREAEWETERETARETARETERPTG